MNRTLKALLEISESLELVEFDKSKCRRFGSINDGGYILLDELEDDDFLISFGIGNDVEFENQIADRGISSHLYDNSITNLPKAIPGSVFFNETIGPKPLVTIYDALKRIPDSARAILKMDIEGSEWQTLEFESKDTLSRFSQLVVEFHNLSEIAIDSKAQLIVSVLRKMNEIFFVANLHANNNGDFMIIENVPLPDVLEVTYLNRKYYSKLLNRPRKIEKDFLPNNPCNPNKPEIFLSFLNLPRQQNLNLPTTGVVSAFEFSVLKRKNLELEEQVSDLSLNLSLRTRERDELLNSSIWRLTAPLRNLSEFLRRNKFL